MKLLVLSPVFPEAPSDGDRLRLFHWLRLLSRRHELHLACFADPARAEDWGPGLLGSKLTAVHRVPLSAWGRRSAALRRLASPLPLSLAAASSGRMRRLCEALALESFDAVLAYRLKMAPYALRFRGPRCLDYTDSLTRYAERRAAALALQGRPFGAWHWRGQAAKLAAWEAYCAGQFEAGFFNARSDREAVAAMAPAAAERLFTAANGVELGPLPRQAREPASFLFVGHLAYPPNAEAAAWLIRELLPRLRRLVPAAKLSIAGGGAPASLRALAKSRGLQLLGYRQDLRPLLASASVSLCPVFSGAGVQNKLLEAFAAGLPAVASPLAAEGAGAQAGRHLLVASQPQAFAEAAARLLKEKALAARLAGAARDLLRRGHRWEASVEVLDQALAGAVRRPLW